MSERRMDVEVVNPEDEPRGTRGIFGQIYSLFSSSVDLAAKIQKSREKNILSERNDIVKQSGKVRFEDTNEVNKLIPTTTTTTTPSTTEWTSLVNGSYTNSSSSEEKGIFDDIANGINSFFDSGGPAIDTGENLGIVPNHCW